MRYVLSDLAQLDSLPYDTVIDVRAPSEYAQDHIPGAINLPVLDDDERARVGTIYVRENRFLARKIGAALVARNAARHLEGPLADKSGAWRPLVCCWRGGQRSGSLASILAQVGWRVGVLEGGYQTYRRAVVAMLYDRPVTQPMVLLDGNTGTAKTDLLGRIGALGGQVIDLEGLAAHRGSVFGPTGVAQPAQKGFESALAVALRGLDPARPVLLEAESNRIGDVSIPAALWKAMCAAPRIRVTAPLSARARFLARAYSDVTADATLLAARLNALRRFHAAERIETWLTWAREGRFVDLAQALMAEHYDPRYGKSQARSPHRMLGEVALGQMDDGDLARGAAEVLALAQSANVGTGFQVNCAQ